MEQDMQTPNGASDLKSFFSYNQITIAIIFFIFGALVSGIIVFWAQKQMLIAAKTEIRRCAKLEAHYQKIKKSLDSQLKHNNEFFYKRVGLCNGKECLFQGSDAIEGYGYLEGYYSTRKRMDSGDVPVTCNALTVTKGSEKLVKNLLEWVEEGNTINTIDDEGNLVVNISFKDLSERDKRLIKNSTVNNKVKLKVIRITPQGRDVPACASLVDIIAVE